MDLFAFWGQELSFRFCSPHEVLVGCSEVPVTQDRSPGHLHVVTSGYAYCKTHLVFLIALMSWSHCWDARLILKTGCSIDVVAMQ